MNYSSEYTLLGWYICGWIIWGIGQSREKKNLKNPDGREKKEEKKNANRRKNGKAKKKKNKKG